LQSTDTVETKRHMDGNRVAPVASRATKASAAHERLLTSVQNNLPSQYRARAQEARDRAAAAQDEDQRKLLLHDADLWERMAEYEEKATPRR